MPNWCSTTIAIYGDQDDLFEIWNCLNKLELEEKPRVKNGFGKLWEGCVLDYFGIDWHEINCRGSIEQYGIEEKNGRKWLQIWQEDAWYANIDYWLTIFDKAKLKLKLKYMAEEPGMDIYETNDKNREFFTDKYTICYCAEADIPELGIKCGDEYEEYFSCKESLLAAFDNKAKSVKEIEDILEAHSDDLSWWRLRKFEVI